MHWRQRITQVVIVILTSLTASAFASQLTHDWQSPDYILKAFQEIALKNEYRQTDERIMKWEKPIRYRYVFYKLPENDVVKQLSETHLKHLAEITQHPIIQSQEAQDSNLNIIFTRDAFYQETINRYTSTDVKNLGTESHCMGTIRHNRNNEILKAMVIIPVDHAMSRGILPACVVEELTQVMGLPNDSDWVAPSIANDQSRLDLLTGLDYILLKLLYDNDIKAGMGAEEATPILKNRIQAFEKEGLIRRAGNQVNRSGVYQLLY